MTEHEPQWTPDSQTDSHTMPTVELSPTASELGYEDTDVELYERPANDTVEMRSMDGNRISVDSDTAIMNVEDWA